MSAPLNFYGRVDRALKDLQTWLARGLDVTLSVNISARQLKQVDRGLTQNLGGHPHQNVCAVSILGRHGA